MVTKVIANIKNDKAYQYIMTSVLKAFTDDEFYGFVNTDE